VGTLMAHVNDPLPPMRQTNPKLQASPTMENIVYRCLEKEPTKRFNSMKDLLNALKRIGNEDGAGLTDTHESMPMARVEGPSSIVSSDSLVTPPSFSGAQQISDSGSGSVPRFASPSVSETLSSSPQTTTDTDLAAVNAPNKGRTYVWGGVAVAVALGIGLVVVLSSGKPPVADPGTPAATPSSVASAQPTVAQQPPQTQTASASPTVGSQVPVIRQVRVESDPSGASVSEGDTQLCSSTPCELTWKDDAARAEHKLQINKKGYKTHKVTVSATDEKVKAALDVIPVVPVAQPQPRPPTTGKPQGLYKDLP
jgi:serine/threonine-protein kinase